jgi:hypothetical protein
MQQRVGTGISDIPAADKVADDQEGAEFVMQARITEPLF